MPHYCRSPQAQELFWTGSKKVLDKRSSIFFARKFLRRSMDCRVKPGNDDLKLAPMWSSPRMTPERVTQSRACIQLGGVCRERNRIKRGTPFYDPEPGVTLGIPKSVVE